MRLVQSIQRGGKPLFRRRSTPYRTWMLQRAGCPFAADPASASQQQHHGPVYKKKTGRKQRWITPAGPVPPLSTRSGRERSRVITHELQAPSACPWTVTGSRLPPAPAISTALPDRATVRRRPRAGVRQAARRARAKSPIGGPPQPSPCAPLTRATSRSGTGPPGVPQVSVPLRTATGPDPRPTSPSFSCHANDLVHELGVRPRVEERTGGEILLWTPYLVHDQSTLVPCLCVCSANPDSSRQSEIFSWRLPFRSLGRAGCRGLDARILRIRLHALVCTTAACSIDRRSPEAPVQNIIHSEIIQRYFVSRVLCGVPDAVHVSAHDGVPATLCTSNHHRPLVTSSRSPIAIEQKHAARDPRFSASLSERCCPARPRKPDRIWRYQRDLPPTPPALAAQGSRARPAVSSARLVTCAASGSACSHLWKTLFFYSTHLRTRLRRWGGRWWWWWWWGNMLRPGQTSCIHTPSSCPCARYPPRYCTCTYPPRRRPQPEDPPLHEIRHETMSSQGGGQVGSCQEKQPKKYPLSLRLALLIDPPCSIHPRGTSPRGTDAARGTPKHEPWMKWNTEPRDGSILSTSHHVPAQRIYRYIYHMSNRPERGKKERGEGNIISPLLLFSNLHRCVIWRWTAITPPASPMTTGSKPPCRLAMILTQLTTLHYLP